MKVTAPYTDNLEIAGKTYKAGQPFTMSRESAMHHVEAGIRLHDEDGNHLTLARLHGLTDDATDDVVPSGVAVIAADPVTEDTADATAKTRKHG